MTKLNNISISFCRFLFRKIHLIPQVFPQQKFRKIQVALIAESAESAELALMEHTNYRRSVALKSYLSPLQLL